MEENNIYENQNTENSSQNEVNDNVFSEETVTQVIQTSPYDEPDFTVITDYKPIEYAPTHAENKVSTGIKVFTVIMAAVVLITGSCVGGYLLGLHKYSKSYSKDNLAGLNLASKPPETDELTAAQVYEQVNKSVVGITAYGSDGAQSVASGVVFSEDGYIITNDHIYDEIAGAKFIVKTYNGEEFSASFVAGDIRSDLAVLKVDAKGFVPAVFGNDRELVIGENVVAIGRPNNIEENSITEGIISLKERRVSTTSSYSMKMIQTSTPINPGNSGGALVNMYGQVIGITSSKISGEEYEGIGFAIPSGITKFIVESLIKNGYVADRARLGVSYQVINKVTMAVKKYPSTGILIVSVNNDSDLYGKVNVGDIITQVNGIDITSDGVILDQIEGAKPGDTLTFTVYTASGSYKTVQGKLLPDTGSSSYVKALIE